MPSRRSFLGLLGAGAALPALTAREAVAHPAPRADVKWDMSWVDRIGGSFRAVFDTPEINDGAGMFRAVMWREQYKEVYGTDPAEMSAVLVIRHAALPMVMSDAFWDRYQIGKARKIKDGKDWARRNPYRSSDGMPKQWAMYSLEAFRDSGGTILACNLAFGQMVSLVAQKEKLKQAEARTEALRHLLPGVTLMPSGIFAVARAQAAGCVFVAAA
ncbi:MAG TPA: hypothetical protein VFN90_01590 [Gemmatimonadales bacterium]|nr:hypothetical protein [Gemmatimonadales bacterium]